MNKGIFYGIGAYVIWGFFPIYFKLIHEVPAIQVVSHRIVWSFLFLSILLFARKEWRSLRAAILGPKFLLVFLVSSMLLGLNWLIYVYGVNAGFIVETSLGYFINPLVSILLGVFVLRERLRPQQWAPIGIATLGVIYLAFNYGRLPWIALMLALTFGLYGLAKKTAPLGSLYGLTLETGMLFIPCLIFLLVLQSSGSDALSATSLRTSTLLMLTGPVTAIPLLLFGTAAKKIDLSMLGLLQYIAPTLQFLIGVLVYREPFTIQSFIGFCIIWAALILLWLEGYLEHRRLKLIAQV